MHARRRRLGAQLNLVVPADRYPSGHRGRSVPDLLKSIITAQTAWTGSIPTLRSVRGHTPQVSSYADHYLITFLLSRTTPPLGLDSTHGRKACCRSTLNASTTS